MPLLIEITLSNYPLYSYRLHSYPLYSYRLHYNTSFYIWHTIIIFRGHMLRTFIEAYAIMAYILLHLTLFTCDSSCLLPIASITTVIPPAYSAYIHQVIAYFNMDILKAQLIAQVLIIGNMFAVLISMVKFLNYIVRRFFVALIIIKVCILMIKEFGIYM